MRRITVVKKHALSIITAIAAVELLLCMANAAGDTIVLKNGKTFQGAFQGFKTGKFYFQPHEGKRIHQTRMAVELLEIDPPAMVLVKQRGGKKIKDIRLKSYRKAGFIFLRDGKELNLPNAKVSSIKMELDFGRAMKLQEEAADSPDDPTFDLNASVKTGIVTVVHFHMPGVMSSIRQGNYLKTLEKRSKGAFVVVRAEVDDWADPIAVKHAIRSAPQFWFYNRKGNLSGKLVDRFTTGDIDSALSSARH